MGGGPGGGGYCVSALGACGLPPLETKYADVFRAGGSSLPDVAGANPFFFGTRVVLDLDIPARGALGGTCVSGNCSQVVLGPGAYAFGTSLLVSRSYWENGRAGLVVFVGGGTLCSLCEPVPCLICCHAL